MEVTENEPFALECYVTGQPIPRVSWFKNDENIDNSPDFILTEIAGMCTLKVSWLPPELFASVYFTPCPVLIFITYAVCVYAYMFTFNLLPVQFDPTTFSFCVVEANCILADMTELKSVWLL